MFHKITNQAEFDIVTLDDAKAQCRLMPSFTMDDTYLTSLIEVCSDLAQTYTNRLLTVGTVDQVWEFYERSVFVFGGEVTEITSLTGEDTSGDTVTIEDYTFNEVSQSLSIPSSYSSYTNFTATFTAGYATVPSKVKQGILLMIASMYNNREDGLVGQTYQKLPFTSTALLNSVRL